jgi:hypothetical protein
MYTIARLFNFKLNKSCYSRLLNTTASLKDAGHYDVIIAGGGLVGTSLLVSLGMEKKLFLILKM